MNHDSAAHPLFHPLESAALFGPEEHEVFFSPAGLHYLGIVPEAHLRAHTGARPGHIAC